MKKWIKAATYSKALQAICDGLKSEGLDARVNVGHRCVDVFDSNGKIREQRYPCPSGTRPSTRGKFVYVGPGLGDYVLTQVSYDKKEYSPDGGLVKYIERTN